LTFNNARRVMMLSKEYVELKDYLYNFKAYLNDTCKNASSYEEVVVRNRIIDLVEHIEIVEDIIEGQIEFNLELIESNTAESC
jgi:hypothetical protein